MAEDVANKSEWVRKQPPQWTAEQVLEQAAKDGIEISRAYVHTIRSAARRETAAKASTQARAKPRTRTRAKPDAAPKARPRALPAPANGHVSETHRRALATLIVDLGFSATESLLGEMRGKLEASLSGD